MTAPTEVVERAVADLIDWQMPPALDGIEDDA